MEIVCVTFIAEKKAKVAQYRITDRQETHLSLLLRATSQLVRTSIVGGWILVCRICTWLRVETVRSLFMSLGLPWHGLFVGIQLHPISNVDDKQID
jgi:hypothetical protein